MILEDATVDFLYCAKGYLSTVVIASFLLLSVSLVGKFMLYNSVYRDAAKAVCAQLEIEPELWKIMWKERC